MGGGRRECQLAREIADADPVTVLVEGLQQAEGFFDGLNHGWIGRMRAQALLPTQASGGDKDAVRGIGQLF